MMLNNLSPDQWGYFKFATGSAAIIVAGVVIWILNDLRPVFDDELCIVGSLPPGHTVMSIDISEEADAITLVDVIRAQSKNLPQYHRLSVFRIADLNEKPTDDERIQGLWPLVRVFSACNPGRGDQVNPWIVGSRFAEKRYQKKFAGPLDEMIRKTAERAGSQTSPILNALALVPLIEHFGPDIAERILHIRSDFLQNTKPQYTQYSEDIKNVDYALSKIGVGVPEFRGIKVHVDFVHRIKYAHWQTNKLRAFWTDYFKRTGVSTVFEQSVRKNKTLMIGDLSDEVF